MSTVNGEGPPDGVVDNSEGFAFLQPPPHDTDSSQGPTTTEEPVVADAVFLEDHHHGGIIPSAGEALAIDNNSYAEELAVDTIRLNSTNIISIRDMDLRDRPEYLSVILCSLRGFHTASLEGGGVLGLSLGVAPDEQLVVTHLAEESPLLTSAVAVGDSLLSLNGTNCKSMSPDAALALLSSLITSGSDRGTTLLFHNPGGNARRVATTVEKPFAEAKLGLKLSVNTRGAVIITSLSPNEVLASSLLNISDRVISVNQHDCTSVATSALPVSQWIAQAPRYVTIVVETLTTTGVVVATGNAAPWALATHIGGTATATATASAPARTANSTSTGADPRPKSTALCLVCCILVIIIVMIIIIAASVGGVAQSNNEDFDDFTPSPTVTPIPPPNLSCAEAEVLQVNGFARRGTNVGAANGNRAANCRDVSSEALIPFGANVWYTFIAPDDRPVVISICNDDAFAGLDTFMTVYVGSCNFSLACVNSNDDSDCGLSSRIGTTPSAGLQYYVQVHGYNGAVGSFGIKVVNALDPGFAVSCACAYEPSPAPTATSPTSSPGPTSSRGPPSSTFSPGPASSPSVF